MAKQVPEGWYPDPAGSPYRRWWDGSQWTRHTDEPPVRPGAARAEAQAPREEAPASPDAPNPEAAADAGNAPPVPPAGPVPPPYGAAPGYGTPPPGPSGYGPSGYGPSGYGPAAYGSPGYGQPAFRPQRFVAPYASFWQRVGGAIIDSLILGIPLAIVVLLLFWQDLVDAIDAAAASGTPTFDPSTTGSFLLLIVIAAIASGTYFTFTIALRGATVGMSVVRIQVVDEQGQMPSVGRAFGRWAFVQLFQWATNLIPFVGGLVWLLDPLWMLWDPEKQTLHDKVAKTWVLQKLPEQTPLQGQPPAQ